MDSFQLKCFISVESHLNFSKAAEDCHVAQSTISRQISTLEQELGVKLFERDSHGVKVTAAGAMMAHYAPVFLEYQKTISDRVRNASTTGYHSLRIAVGPYEYSLLRKPLRLIQKMFPNISVDLTIYTYYVLLTRYRNKVLDFALCNELCAAQMPDFTGAEISNAPWLLVAGEDNPIWTADKDEVRTLAGQALITLVNDQFDGVRQYCHDNFINPKMIETNFLSTLLELVQANLGVAILPPFVKNTFPPGIIAKDILNPPFSQRFFIMGSPHINTPDSQLLTHLLIAGNDWKTE